MIDTGDATGFLEQGWIERRFAIGDSVEIAISEHCKRCVMTTLPQGDLPFDPAILHTATAYNNTHAGVYATVVRPGAINSAIPCARSGDNCFDGAMQVQRYSDARAFYDRILPALEPAERENNLLLGAARRLAYSTTPSWPASKRTGMWCARHFWCRHSTC